MSFINLNYTIKDIQDGLEKGGFSAEEIISHYQTRIGLENKKLNAYLSVFDSSSIQNTKYKIQNTLYGVPCAIKDNILIDGTIATAGSKILENYKSVYDATVIAKLKTAGVWFLGKTNMDEFAMGSSTENSGFKPAKNPHNTEHVPGGSSGGSAAAVAADLCVFALGSDTGGSIRQPASFCGVVGLKPTYGRVSRHGLIAMSSSLDQVGPITKTVEDSAIVLNVISGKDKFDSTTVSNNAPDFTKNLNSSIKGVKVGVCREQLGEGLDSEVRERVEDCINQLESMGCNVKDISLPHLQYALAVYYIVMPSEVSSNLARFDGIRYGYSSKEGKTLADVYENSRSEMFGMEVKKRIMLGAHALSSGYYDAYYLKAQKVRRLIKTDFDDAFNSPAGGVDVVVGPTTPSVAFKFGEKLANPLSMYLSDVYTVPANLVGLPAISVPCGSGSKSGLPVGFHIVGKSFDEETILRIAYQLEKEIGNRK